MFFFFNDTATTEIYTLSLHDALPICARGRSRGRTGSRPRWPWCCSSPQWSQRPGRSLPECPRQWTGLHEPPRGCAHRSEEHTSELQSRQYLVCRLLLEKKKNEQSNLP